MNEQFTHIATVLFEHTYFSNRVFESMEITVQNKTLKIFNNLGVVVKPFMGGFHLLSSDIHLLKENKKDGVFRFEMCCNDPYFINYTALPHYQPSSQLCYFSNNNAYKTSDAIFQLHKDYVGNDSVVQVVGRKLILSSFKESANYTFQMASSGFDITHQVQQHNSSFNTFTFDNVSQGAIDVLENNKHSQRIYYNPSTLWQKPTGIIEIDTGHLYEHYLENSTTITYVVQFEARKTFWEYYLSKNTLESFENIAIIDMKQEERFTYKGTDDSSVIYRSNTPIYLSQSLEDQFQLVYNFTPETVSNRAYGIVVNQLPNPSSNQLYPNKEDPNAPLFSHIYIHI